MWLGIWAGEELRTGRERGERLKQRERERERENRWWTKKVKRFYFPL